MPAANMREDGVRSISATCETCQHEAVLNADRWPADMPVPDIGLKLANSRHARTGLTVLALKGPLWHKAGWVGRHPCNELSPIAPVGSEFDKCWSGFSLCRATK